MDATLWSWLAIAAMGALHGLNPLTGWGLATTWSLCARDHSMPLRALLPMAVGHLAAVALTACLLYTSPSPRDQRGSRMPSSA